MENKAFKTIDVLTKEVYGEGEFVRKASDIMDADLDMDNGYYDFDRYKIDQIVLVNEAEFEDLIYGLLNDRPYLKGKGGTYSDADVPDVENLWNLTEDQQNAFWEKAYRNCVLVATESLQESIIIDPQGYTYARYVCVGYHNEVLLKELLIFQDLK